MNVLGWLNSAINMLHTCTHASDTRRSQDGELLRLIATETQDVLHRSAVPCGMQAHGVASPLHLTTPAQRRRLLDDAMLQTLNISELIRQATPAVHMLARGKPKMRTPQASRQLRCVHVLASAEMVMLLDRHCRCACLEIPLAMYHNTMRLRARLRRMRLQVRLTAGLWP